MSRTASDILQGATLSLTRSGALKDRLTDAYRNHLSCLDESDLPKELREEFRSLHHAMTREPPLLRGEDAVRATIRKMSSGEAEAAATSVVRMFCMLHRSTGPVRAASPATIVPIFIAADARAAEA